nr:class I SAM-dependent methyltransferase [uncultured Allomuricauda sp.]
METTEKDLAIFEGDRAFNYDNFVQQWIPNYDYFMSTVSRLLSSVTEKTLLSVGCGTGNEILVLKETDAKWSVVGVDPSPEMIEIARKKLAHLKKLKLIVGEVEHLDYQNYFGAASLILVLHFIRYPKEKLKLLAEIYNRLKPGAPLIIMGIFGNKEQLRVNLDVLQSLLPQELSQKEITERLERITTRLYRTSENDLVKLLVRAGFQKPTRFFQCSIYSGWITRKNSS